MTHTKGPWTAFQDKMRRRTIGTATGRICDMWGQDPAFFTEEDEANARLIAAAPELLEAIATAGRIVGQVQDNPRMSASERAYALSRACDALGGTYFSTTGKPLEWWQPEPAIAKAEEVSA
jgi:hypothetical protein